MAFSTKSTTECARRVPRLPTHMEAVSWGGGPTRFCAIVRYMTL
jgi:hypothetical protein